jgi:hypothetical protein
MANSGTVTAGSAALASQYNNLRDDVLNVSTGHTHTGASENGKKVHGTALDTTGATNGQVLTANGSGGASFAALASSGAFSVTYATATFSTAVATTTKYLTGTSSGNCSLGVGSGGSVLMTITGNNAYSASARTIRVFTLGNGTHTATTSLTAVGGGTSIADQIGGAGFKAGTTFTIKENNGSGTHRTVLRKFTTGLTNSWNTTLMTISLAGQMNEQLGPFGGGGEWNIKWAQELGAWYGGDYRTPSYATATTGGAGTVSVWLVNDASGSAYSAPFGTASSVYEAQTYATVFVPDNVGTPTAGTIHAWGVSTNASGTAELRYCVYTVGSASITAVSTAVPEIFTRLSTTRSVPMAALWDADRQQILLWVGLQSGVIALDRTGGTVLWKTGNSGLLRMERLANLGVRPVANSEGDIATQYDPTSGMMMTTYSGRPIMFKYGAVGPSMIPFSPIQTNVDTSMYAPGCIAGAGSATDYVYGYSNAGTVYSQKISGIASVTVAGTASNAFRQITADLYSPVGPWNILSFDAQNGYEVGFGGTTTEQNGFFPEGYHIVPGTVSFKMNIAMDSNSIESGGYRFNFNPATETAKYMTYGGTAKVIAQTITMA